MAIASAIFAIPGAGIGIGNLMMKSEKLASAGKAVRAVSKLTQSAIGVGAGMSIATVGYQNLRHSIEAGEFSLTDLATFIGGLTIAAMSGKGFITSGKDLMACSDDLAKMWKKTKSRVSENFRKFMNDNGGFVDLDALVGINKAGPYSNLTDSRFVGAGKKFTPSQKKKIIQQNMERNGGVIKSDLSGEVLVPATQSRKGIVPNPLEAQIDHIHPRSKGGSNSYSNAQVLSRSENIIKSDKDK